MNRLAYIGVAALFFGASSMVEPKPDESATYYVPLVSLIVNPGKYIGLSVAVAGFLDKSGEVLYLSKDFADALDIVSGVFVSIAYRDSDISEQGVPSTGCEDQFVRVFGVVEQRNGDLRIKSVYRIQTFNGEKRTSNCWSNPQGPSSMNGMSKELEVPPNTALQSDKGKLSCLLPAQKPRQLAFAAELGC